MNMRVYSWNTNIKTHAIYDLRNNTTKSQVNHIRDHDTTFNRRSLKQVISSDIIVGIFLGNRLNFF